MVGVALHGILGCQHEMDALLRTETPQVGEWHSLPAAFRTECERLVRAALELDLGLLHDFCAVDTSASPNTDDTSLPPLRAENAASHYQSSAALDGSDRRVWQLYAAAVRRAGVDPSFVHAAAVARGLWARADQRPLQLVPSLVPHARAWHDPESHPACRVLVEQFAAIREELCALLARQLPAVACGAPGGGAVEGGTPCGGGPATGDTSASASGVFSETRASASAHGLATLAGGALSNGAWRDLTLYVNGRRHEANCALVPRTAALLGWRLRDDTSSHSCGSAFFSLLAPGARLRPHCGPTNTRLRAHLALLVPTAAAAAGGSHPLPCAMRVGEGERPRAWSEGSCFLFDDSFEHEVWNETHESRVVLIVDLWHPGLSREERAATLDPARRRRYEAVCRTGAFERADTPVAAPSPRAAAPVLAPGGAAHGAAEVAVGGVSRHCAGLHARVLGAHGMRTLDRVVSAVLAESEGVGGAGERGDPPLPTPSATFAFVQS